MNEVSPRKKRRPVIKIFVILLFGAILFGAIYDTFYGKKIIKSMVQEAMASRQKEKKLEEGAELEFTGDSKSSFITYGKGILQSTKDGVKYYTDLKTQKWNDTYTMTSPIMISEGDFAAVAELLGREARVYDDKGFRYQIQTEGSIVQLALNTNGYLVVVTNDKTRYRIIAYDDKGMELATRIDEPAGVFPMSADLSDDNRILSISYLDTTDAESISKVLFFYLNREEGKKFVDQLYAGVDKKGDILPYIAFSKDNKLFGIADNGLTMIDDTGKEIWSKQASNKLLHAAIGKNNFLTVAWGEALSGKDGVAAGTVEWYNQKGEILGTFSAKEAVNYLKIWNDITIVGAGRTYYALTTSGKIVWEYHAVEDVVDILPFHNQNTVLYITQSKAVIKNMAQESTKTEKQEPAKEEPAENTGDGVPKKEEAQQSTGAEADSTTPEKQAEAKKEAANEQNGNEQGEEKTP